jgi:hypothetical protein
MTEATMPEVATNGIVKGRQKKRREKTLIAWAQWKKLTGCHDIYRRGNKYREWLRKRVRQVHGRLTVELDGRINTAGQHNREAERIDRVMSRLPLPGTPGGPSVETWLNLLAAKSRECELRDKAVMSLGLSFSPSEGLRGSGEPDWAAERRRREREEAREARLPAHSELPGATISPEPTDHTTDPMRVDSGAFGALQMAPADDDQTRFQESAPGDVDSGAVGEVDDGAPDDIGTGGGLDT